MAADASALAPLEIASHVLLGADETVRAVPNHAIGPVEALEASLLEALRRPPCLVSFSGGRDSSPLLALAMRVARREGLPEPVPITQRFEAAPATHEDEWQALIVDHVGCREWILDDHADELDLLGPVARELMRRDGLPFPYNRHLMWPMIAQARGGSFVTGLGGDQALDAGGREHDVLARRARPGRQDLARVAVAAAPRRVRRTVLRSRVDLSFPWLRPEANAALSERWLDHLAAQPLRWDSGLRCWWRSRLLRVALASISELGAAADVRVHHPFATGPFLEALARGGGATGYGSRTAAMRALFHGLLPDELMSRPTKASFDQVLWNRHARRFVAGLDAAELEQRLGACGADAVVDAVALKAHWDGPAPMANSFLLLQSAWLGA
jgi:hypothetical protein